MDDNSKQPNELAQVIRAKLMEGRALVPDFALGIRKSPRAVSDYIAKGMPTEWVGNTPYVVVDPALEWLRNRRKRLSPPQGRGRPVSGTSAHSVQPDKRSSRVTPAPSTSRA